MVVLNIDFPQRDLRPELSFDILYTAAGDNDQDEDRR